MTRFTAYSSRLWNLFLLLLVLAFLSPLYFFSARIPLPFLIVSGLLGGAGILALLYGMFSSQPRLVIDENGISCYKPFYATIPWEDVIRAERVPRIEKVIVRGKAQYNMSFSEAWRPVDITVQGIEKYSKILPAKLHHLLTAPFSDQAKPSHFRLRLEMTGLKGSSAEVMECIGHYLHQRWPAKKITFQ